MGRKILLFVFCICLSAVTVAQDVRVIPLSSEDAQEAKTKYAAMKAAEKSWDDFQQKIAKKYTEVPYGDPDAGNMIVESVGALSGGAFTLGGADPCDSTHRAKNKEFCDAQEKALNDERFSRKGFEFGFQFDKNLQYLLPKPAELQTKSPCGYGMWPAVTTSQ